MVSPREVRSLVAMPPDASPERARSRLVGAGGGLRHRRGGRARARGALLRDLEPPARDPVASGLNCPRDGHNPMRRPDINIPGAA